MKRKQANFKTSYKGCFEGFLNLTKPMHKMTDQEIKVVTLFMYHHYKEKHNFSREEDLWKFLFDYDTKLKIREEIGVSNPVFQNILTSLRKKKVIVNNRLAPYFMLNLEPEDRDFELIFRFHLR